MKHLILLSLFTFSAVNAQPASVRFFEFPKDSTQAQRVAKNPNCHTVFDSSKRNVLSACLMGAVAIGRTQMPRVAASEVGKKVAVGEVPVAGPALLFIEGRSFFLQGLDQANQTSLANNWAIQTLTAMNGGKDFVRQENLYWNLAGAVLNYVWNRNVEAIKLKMVQIGRWVIPAPDRDIEASKPRTFVQPIGERQRATVLHNEAESDSIHVEVPNPSKVENVRPVSDVLADIGKATKEKERVALMDELEKAIAADQGKIGEIAAGIAIVRIGAEEKKTMKAGLTAAVLAGGETLEAFLAKTDEFLTHRAPLIELINAATGISEIARRELLKKVHDAKPEEFEGLESALTLDIYRRQCEHLLEDSYLADQRIEEFRARIASATSLDALHDLLGEIQYESNFAEGAARRIQASDALRARAEDEKALRAELLENLNGIDGLTPEQKEFLENEIAQAQGQGLKAIGDNLEAIRNAEIGIHTQKALDRVVEGLVHGGKQLQSELAEHLNHAPVPSLEVIRAIFRRHR